MADFRRNSGSRDDKRIQWRDALAGHDSNVDCGGDYRLTEVAAERAIVVGVGRLIRRVVRVSTGTGVVVMMAAVVVRCGFSRHMVIVPMAPTADEQIGRLQGNREQGDQELKTARHDNTGESGYKATQAEYSRVNTAFKCKLTVVTLPASSLFISILGRTREFKPNRWL